MADGASAADTRKARDFIRDRGLFGRGVSPCLLAGAKRDLGKPLSETLSVLADLMDAGQGQGPSPDTEDMA